jgi:macrolide-specific efflux system membrane fusion protein
MTRNKYIKLVVIIIVLAGIFLFVRVRNIRQQNADGLTSTVKPVVGEIALTVSTTGVVEPQNRLEIKPSISGRVEDILFHEGDRVRIGDIVAWISSTERAALVDAARSQGGETLKYWEEVYKKTPLISPIHGEVIVRPVEPGQTMATSDVVLVLSDRLVVSAQFDETDIGRVAIGQEALITLDAYPDIKLEGVVDHVAYESQIINNVTIYDVDIILNDIPQLLRSGMSVAVEVTEKTVTDVLTLPTAAIQYDGERQFVFVQGDGDEAVEQDVSVGLSNGSTSEITSGLTEEDTVVVQGSAYEPGKRKSGINPFMPFGRKSRSQK